MRTLSELRGAAPVDDERSSQLNLAPWWLALCGFVVVAMIAAAHIKGGYIDEYYTMSFADSTAPLRKAFDAWSKDPHPVGFYALNRLADMVLPQDLFDRRLTNLVYFGIALLIAWSTGKRHRAFALLFIASMASSPYLIERFAEYRSTFLGLMIVAMIVVRVRVALDHKDRWSGLVFIPLLTALLGFVDYPLAVPALAVCGGWAVIALLDRNGRGVVAAIVAAVACLIALAISILNAHRFHVPYDPYFESFPALVRDLAVVTVTAILPCLAMVALAAVEIIGDRVPVVKAATATRFAQLLLIAMLLTLVGFFLLNVVTHSLIRRQIFGIIPLIVAYLTETSLPHLKARPVTVALIAANILLVAGGSAAVLKSKRNFDRYGPEITRAQHSCASLPVYGLLPEWMIRRRDNRFHMKDQFAIGLEDVAHRDGFRLRLAKPAGTWIDPKCGALLWSEAMWLDRPPTTQVIASRLGLQVDPATLRSAKLEWVDQESRRQYSMLMRVPPPGQH